VLFGAFRLFYAIVLLRIWFNICHAVIFAVNLIIQVAIPVESNFGAKNSFTGAILIIFDWMTVDS
jgi:hypothetical protein